MVTDSTTRSSESTAAAARLGAAELSSRTLTQALAPLKTSTGAARSPPSSAEIFLTALLAPSLPSGGEVACRSTAPQPSGTSPTCISPDARPWRHGEASQELGKVRGPHRGPDHGVGMGVELAKTPALGSPRDPWVGLQPEPRREHAGPCTVLTPCSLPLPAASWFLRGLDQQLLSRQ